MLTQIRFLFTYRAFLLAVAPFRNVVSKHESEVASEQEERRQALAQKVMAATMEQIKGQLEDDISKTRATLPTRMTQTAETALDMKYLRDRQKNFGNDIINEVFSDTAFQVFLQFSELEGSTMLPNVFFQWLWFATFMQCLLRKGKDFVEDWMYKHCKVTFHSVKDDSESSCISNGLSDFSKYLSERIGSSDSGGTTHLEIFTWKFFLNHGLFFFKGYTLCCDTLCLSVCVATLLQVCDLLCGWHCVAKQHSVHDGVSGFAAEHLLPQPL